MPIVMPTHRDTDATLLRRAMDKMGVSERGMAALLDVTQPTVNGILNGTQFLKVPVRRFVRGMLIEIAAEKLLASDKSTTSRACTKAARAGESAFVVHASECQYCIARAYAALEGVG